MLLRSLAHVGLERDRPHTWDARTHAEYPTIGILFQHSDADEKVTAQIKLYTMPLCERDHWKFKDRDETKL